MATPILAYSIAFMMDAAVTLGGRPVALESAVFSAPLSVLQLAAVIPVAQEIDRSESGFGRRDSADRALLRPGDTVTDIMDNWSFEVAGKLIAQGRPLPTIR